MATILTFGGQSDSGTTLGQVSPEVLESAYVYFVVGASRVDVTSPKGYIKDSTGTKLALKTLNVETSLGSKEYTLTRLGTGFYSISFYTDRMTHGIYDLCFEGTGSVLPYNPITVTGQFVVGFVSRHQDLIYRTRQQLQDVDPSLYTLISPLINAWTDPSLLGFIEATLNDLNFIPPSSVFTIDSCPVWSMLVDGAVVKALRAASVRENWNTMSYSDEYNLSISRAPFFKDLAAQMQLELMAKMERYKYWIGLYGDDGVGSAVSFAEQSLPFQISRVLSWLPGMKNTFGL